MVSIQEDSSSRRASLRHLFLWLLVGVVGLFMAGMALSIIFSLHSSKLADERLLELEAQQTKASVMRNWEYYREWVERQARDPGLVALLQHGSAADQRQWETSRHGLLPNAPRLVLERALSNRLGNAHLLDSELHSPRALPDTGASVQTFIRRDASGRKYLALIAPVRDADGNIPGRVILSVRLNQLQRILNDSALPSHAITLLDAVGQPIVSSAGVLRGARREVIVRLPAMGWNLRVQLPLQRLNAAGGLQLLAGMLTLAGVLLVLVIVVLRLRHPIRQDMHAVLDALACLTRNESAPRINTRYVEFAPVAEDINRIAQQLHDQREQLAKLSLTDTLTGMHNRRAFETQFPYMLGLAARDHAVTLICLDLDRFKEINDTLGHAAGDQVLVALANTFKALTRSTDTAFRLAGDEFVVLMCGLDNAGVMAWYHRLADHFRSELHATGLPVENTLSAGQTWLDHDAGETMAKAMARADHALYQAKSRGRGQLVLAEAMSEKSAG